MNNMNYMVQGEKEPLRIAFKKKNFKQQSHMSQFGF